MCYTIKSYMLQSIEPLRRRFPLKYWAGYLTAAIIGAISWALMQMAQKFTTLVDMVFPYVLRILQDTLSEWSAGLDFCLWQTLAVAGGALVIASIVLMVVMRWNPIQWGGWILAAASVVVLLHTLTFGLNYHAGPLAEDIQLEVKEYNLIELTLATTYYRDMANLAADKVDRNAEGEADFGEFEDIAKEAGNGFDHLIYDYSYPVFAGSNLPVKKLGWANMYSSMGITGFFCGITGEAAVNPQIPHVTLPFTMCHEMSHRKSIAVERDANFSAFLACQANDNVNYRYSGYFMAYRYCLSQLKSLDIESAKKIMAQERPELSQDMATYSDFFSSRKDEKATKVANTVNDTYLKANGDEMGIASYDNVCGMLVNWYIQEILIPTYTEEEVAFDPFDESQVDLSGITNAIIVETEPTEPVGGVG